MTDSGPFTITLYNKDEYTYPNFAKVIGWILAISSVSCVPIVAIKTLLSYKGTFGQVLYKFQHFKACLNFNFLATFAKYHPGEGAKRYHRGQTRITRYDQPLDQFVG